MEIRAVRGFAGYYVTEFGEVRRVIRGKRVFVEMDRDMYGYATYKLMRPSGVAGKRRVHRRACEIVAAAFCGEPLLRRTDGGDDIRHIDGDVSNDHYSNLVAVPRNADSSKFDRSLKSLPEHVQREHRRDYLASPRTISRKLIKKPAVREIESEIDHLSIVEGQFSPKSPFQCSDFRGHRGFLSSDDAPDND